MDLRGFEHFTLVDYPGKIGCIVFTGGCNFRCPFCHNPCLVFDPGSQPRITEREVINFLRQRQGLLEGVVISGGEPLLQIDIAEFITRIKELGFLVKLDTNGSLPERLQLALSTGGVSALGIDYKTPASRYNLLTGCNDPDLTGKLHKSLELALDSGVELDVRTTVHRALLSMDDLQTMFQELTAIGVKQWTLQQFNPVEVIDDELSSKPTYSDRELVAMAKTISPAIRVRGLHGHIMQ